MYAKLMARITESSLMDEAIPVRYTFMTLLAVADPKGYVIGTDVAISRRLNMPVDEFKECLAELMKPDQDSNSKEHEGRRVIISDCERGYLLVNYVKYRDTRDEEHRREYMRDYMRKKRAENDVAPVNIVNKKKRPLAQVEGDEKAQEKVNGEAVPPPSRGVSEGKQSDMVPTTDQSRRIAAVFHRKLTTAWTGGEIGAYRKMGTLSEEDLAAVETYYSTNWPPRRDVNILRHDILTFLNNYAGEIDRAKAALERKSNGHNHRPEDDGKL